MACCLNKFYARCYTKPKWWLFINTRDKLKYMPQGDWPLLPTCCQPGVLRKQLINFCFKTVYIATFFRENWREKDNQLSSWQAWTFWRSEKVKEVRYNIPYLIKPQGFKAKAELWDTRIWWLFRRKKCLEMIFFQKSRDTTILQSAKGHYQPNGWIVIRKMFFEATVKVLSFDLS